MGPQQLEKIAPSRAIAAGLGVEVESDPAGFARLRDEWRDLLAVAGAYSVALTPGYVEAAWATIENEAGVRLALMTVRRGDRLVGLWPLHVRRQSGLAVANHIGAGDSGEYSAPLIATDDDPAAIAAAMLAQALGLADLLSVYALAADSPLAVAIRASPKFKYSNDLPSPVVTLEGFDGLEAWLATKSGSFRQELRAGRKKLSAQGQFEFVRMSGPSDGQALVDWLFDMKRAWAANRRIVNSNILKEPAERLFGGLLTREPITKPAEGDVRGYALRLDGRIISGCINFHSPGRLEFVMTAFDPELRKFAPGHLMVEECVRLAHQDGAVFDFRLTQDSYKLRWANRFDVYQTHILACTPRGAPRVVRLEANRVVRRLRIWASGVRKRLRQSRGGS
jgi:CelD/BcsL family acetyltransferase involved in cellulose biosynthesis